MPYYPWHSKVRVKTCDVPHLINRSLKGLM